ncbi:hypothetical protein GOB84_11315 [Acetobacter sp. LMG 1637]|uniref:Transposase n=1 Tax=Acetobacter fallax TaxID=1737473 RepID=A0ABX0KGU6_9PROT|nr:hypothetical protein [Acetobacter fallax]NHO33137.1 hypothetical protein [Acetobacter fallax]
MRDLPKKGVDPLVAIGRLCTRRPYDFRRLPNPKEPLRVTEPRSLGVSP